MATDHRTRLLFNPQDVTQMLKIDIQSRTRLFIMDISQQQDMDPGRTSRVMLTSGYLQTQYSQATAHGMPAICVMTKLTR